MNNGKNYTCLFGGGAIRGLSYIGAIKALEELEIYPKRFAGSSVGSIIAAMLAVGYNSEDIKKLFLNVNYNLFRDIQLGFGPMPALSKGNVFLDWLKEIIEQKFYGDNFDKGKNEPVKFKDLANDLIIITTDLDNFQCQEFSKYTTPDYEVASAIRISSCMPGLMRPVEYEGRTLVDGDLQKSFPMWKLSKNILVQDDRILEFRLEGDFNENENLKNGMDYANAVYSCMTYMSTKFVKNIYSNRDKFDYITLNTGSVLIVDFSISSEKREQLVNMGYEQTIDYFKNYLPDKKRKICDNYNIIHGHLLRIKHYIDIGKYRVLKEKLGELFMNLTELFPIIDLTDFNDIKKFKDLLLTNLHDNLLGFSKLDNKETVSTELKRIIKDVDNKIDELNLYIRQYSK